MKKLSRKEILSVVALRCADMTLDQRAAAWHRLSVILEMLAAPEHLRTPKYRDLLHAIREATIVGKQADQIKTL